MFYTGKHVNFLCLIIIKDKEKFYVIDTLTCFIKLFRELVNTAFTIETHFHPSHGQTSANRTISRQSFQL